MRYDILTKRYRCVWRKARRINRFRAFSGPDSFFQTIDANRCFRASAPIRTGRFPFSGRCIQPAPFLSRVFHGWQRYFSQKNSQRLGRRFVGFDRPKKRRPFSISKRALAAASETAGRRRPLRPHFFTTGGSLTWTPKTQAVSFATLKKSVFPCTVQALKPCRWRERSCLSFGTAHPSAASPARAAYSIGDRMWTRPRQRMPYIASRTSPRRRWSI